MARSCNQQSSKQVPHCPGFGPTCPMERTSRGSAPVREFYTVLTQKSQERRCWRYRYECCIVTAHQFFMGELLAGWCHVEMMERRTTLDDAEHIRWLVDAVSPNAQPICIVQDDVNTLTPAALDGAFPLAEA